MKPPRAKGIVGRDLKFAGYIHHYKIVSGNIFGLNLKKKMATMGVNFDGHQGVLHILRVNLINRKLNLFMIDILIDMCVLYSLNHLTLELVHQSQPVTHKMPHQVHFFGNSVNYLELQHLN